jgi:hypothetical protein
MFVDIPHPPVNHHAFGSKKLGPSRHETAPTGRWQSFRLLDIHDTVILVVVHKVLFESGRRFVAHLDHADCHGGTMDPSLRARREHANTIEKTALWVVELPERICNLCHISEEDDVSLQRRVVHRKL